ncbi:MAG: flavin reductase [Streptosporangiales bacterium]|nr:flavin reductase [Streptosporangiales bacterium]
MGRFATGIAIVTTRHDGLQHAMTVNALTSVSLDPVLVLFCAERVARFHDAVLASGDWAVSVLGEDARDVSQWLAKRGRPLDGQLDGIAHHPGRHTGAAILDDAIGALECRTHAVYDGGDHAIVVGRVLDVGVPRAEGGPLLFYQGEYRELR